MKTQIRTIGIDDAPFARGDKETTIVGVVMRGDSYVEAVMKSEITIDGTDASEKMVAMVANCRIEGLAAILLDGITFGGFNVADVDLIYDRTCVPTITVTRKRPDMQAMRKALLNLPDGESRYELISRSLPVEVPTSAGNVAYARCAGATIDEARLVLRRTTMQGAIPEPLRLAHMIGQAYKTGTSYSKA